MPPLKPNIRYFTKGKLELYSFHLVTKLWNDTHEVSLKVFNIFGVRKSVSYEKLKFESVKNSILTPQSWVENKRELAFEPWLCHKQFCDLEFTSTTQMVVSLGLVSVHKIEQKLNVVSSLRSIPCIFWFASSIWSSVDITFSRSLVPSTWCV